MASGFSLKDQLFNAEKVDWLAARFAAAAPGFDAPAFTAGVMARLPELELKARIAWIAERLGRALPGPLPDIAPVLRAALPPPLDPTRTDDDFGDFILAPWGELTIRRGLEDHPDLVLDLLGEITQRFSMEDQIRAVLNRWPDRAMARLTEWSDHPNYHVRRLVSEGTRPRLPWSERLALPLHAPLPLLDRLQADPTRYVTRSVANHLNDISKDDPDLAMDRIEAWRADARQVPAERDWMTRHALRGLVKAGHPRAMRLIGFDPEAAIDLLAFEMPDRARIGDRFPISVTLKAAAGAGALVDYVFWRRRANGEMAPKVHKMKQVLLRPGTALRIDKIHVLKGDATTYRLYPGPQKIALQVNGRVLASRGFDLAAA